MNTHIPYTYHIAWTEQNLHYYGVRYAEDCSPDDLWKTYFTSSKVVAQKRIEIGEPDIIEVRQTFSNKEDAVAWEHKVLTRFKVPTNESWLNKAITWPIIPEFDEAHRANLSKSAKKRQISDEGRIKLSEAKKKLWKNPEFKKKQSKAMLNGFTDEHGKKIAEFQRGRTRSAEHKAKIVEIRKAEWADAEKTAARKKAISDAVKAKWADPEYREKMLAREKSK
jgi:hypothetical protein